MSFWSELRRRHLVKILIGYVAVGLAVLEGASLLLPSMALPDWTYSLVVAVVLLGLPITLVVGWALTMSPEGEVERVRPRAAAEAEPVPAPVEPPPAPPPPDDRSVAVLPFADLSPGADNEYFSDGITEEILMTLSRVRGLHVISRTSVMRYKGTDRGIPEIAAELNVAHVLEGSVRRFGDRLRITAQLIHAASDGHLWAESYDREVDDIFAIQSDVAERIVRSLRVALSPDERAGIEAAPTHDVEAYSPYLRGRHLLPRRDNASLRQAIEEFDRALERDPDFALAWVGRAEAFALRAVYRYDSAAEAVREARRSARRALEIHPGLAQAHAALGLAATVPWEWGESNHHLRKAIELNPGYATAHHWHAVNLSYQGRIDAAVKSMERALTLDPVSTMVLAALGYVYRIAGRPADAERILRRGIEIDPQSFPLYTNLSSLLESEGRIEESLEIAALATRMGEDMGPAPGVLDALGEAYARGGVEAYWSAHLDLVPADSPYSDRVSALVYLGRIEEALDEMERQVEGHSRGALALVNEPLFQPLRDTPRGRALLERIGVPGAA